MSMIDDIAGAILPGYSQALQETQDNHNKEAEVVRGLKARNDFDELERKRNENLGYVNEAEVYLQNGNLDKAASIFKKISDANPDGEEFVGVDTIGKTGGKVINFKDHVTGTDHMIPLTNQDMSTTLQGLRSRFSDPKENARQAMASMAAIKEANQKSDFQPINDTTDARRLLNEVTGKPYFEIRDNKTGDIKVSDTLPRTAQQGAALELSKMAPEKEKTEIAEKKSQTTKNYAEATQAGASAEHLAADTNKLKTQKFEQYTSDGTDGFPAGTLVRHDTRTGKLEPVNVKQAPDETKILEDLGKSHGVMINAKDRDGLPIAYDNDTAESAQTSLFHKGYTGVWKGNADDGWKLISVKKGTEGVRRKNQESSSQYVVGKTYKDKTGNQAVYRGVDKSGKNIWERI